MKNKVKSLVLLLGLLVVTYLVFFILQPTRFGSAESLFILLQQCLLPSIAACGFYFVLTMGLFDFSIGANIILSALVACMLSVQFGFVGLVIGAVLVGTLVGVANGFLYLKFKIPSIIATVGLMIIYECVASYLAGENSYVLAEEYRILGQAPWNIIIAVIAFAIAMFIIKFTRTGIYIKAIGKNEPMAQNMGVNVSKYKVIGFILCGFFTGITALLTICYSSTVIPVQGMSSMARNFTPIMGCFIGLAFKKYVNPVISIIIGEFIIAMIISGIMTNGLDSTLQNTIIGVILLVIVAAMGLKNKGKAEVVK